MTATRHEYHYDMVANGEVLYLRAKLDNNAGGFVAKYHRHGARTIAIDH
jgi:hypothetical protein